MVSPFGLLSAWSVLEWQATSSPFIRRQEKEVETKKKTANGKIKNESGFLCFHSTWRIMGVFQWASGCCKSSDGGILWGEVHLYSYRSRVILRRQSLPSDRCLVRGAALHGTRGNAWNGKRCKTDRLLFLDLELFEETPCKRAPWSGRT